MTDEIFNKAFSDIKTACAGALAVPDNADLSDAMVEIRDMAQKAIDDAAEARSQARIAEIRALRAEITAGKGD